MTFCVSIYIYIFIYLRCCATNREVAGSIPAGVGGFFIDIKSFRSHCVSGVDSVFSGGKGGRCVRLKTYHHPAPLSRNLGALTSWNPLRLSTPVMGLLYLYICTYTQLKNFIIAFEINYTFRINAFILSQQITCNLIINRVLIFVKSCNPLSPNDAYGASHGLGCDLPKTQHVPGRVIAVLEKYLQYFSLYPSCKNSHKKIKPVIYVPPVVQQIALGISVGTEGLSERKPRICSRGEIFLLAPHT